jgi:hypothetical protein
MELQWNYEETQTTGETTVKSVKHINDELRDVVTQIFENDNDYHDLDLVTKYQQVFETLSFVFEDYRKDFEKIITKRLGDNLTQEQLQVEAIVFCSWVSIEVMTALSNQYMKT